MIRITGSVAGILDFKYIFPYVTVIFLILILVLMFFMLERRIKEVNRLQMKIVDMGFEIGFLKNEVMVLRDKLRSRR